MRTTKNIIKRVLLPILEWYFWLRMIWPVWLYAINFRPRKLWKSEKGKLEGVSERILHDLNVYGIATTHCHELFSDTGVFLGLKDYAENLKNEKAEKKSAESGKLSKPFLINLFESTPFINFDNPFHIFALHQRIIEIVNAYLGMYAKLYYLTLNVTIPIGEGTSAIASQRWHRDPEDKKMCKVFLYLNDVDENAGPFMYVMKSCYSMKYGSIFPQKPPIGIYPDSAILEKNIAREDVKMCTGRAGTIIFCDTSGLHKGGYATLGDRIMFTAGYRTNGAVTPNRISYPEDYYAKLRGMKFTPASQYAASPFTVSRLNRKLFGFTQRWKEELNGKNMYQE